MASVQGITNPSFQPPKVSLGPTAPSSAATQALQWELYTPDQLRQLAAEGNLKAKYLLSLDEALYAQTTPKPGTGTGSTINTFA